MPDQKLNYKTTEKEDAWARAVNAIINGEIPIMLCLPEGEIHISIGDEGMWTLIIEKGGSWRIE